MRIQSGERLVKQDRPRIVQVGAGHGHLLPHAARQLLGNRVALLNQLEQLQELLGLRLQSVDA